MQHNYHNLINDDLLLNMNLFTTANINQYGLKNTSISSPTLIPNISINTKQH